MQPGSLKTVALGLFAATAVFLMLDGFPATAKRVKHVKEKSITAPTARTPTDKTDCIVLSLAFYGAREDPGAADNTEHPARINARRNESR